jgi:hypothetical protein
VSLDIGAIQFSIFSETRAILVPCVIRISGVPKFDVNNPYTYPATRRKYKSIYAPSTQLHNEYVEGMSL